MLQRIQSVFLLFAAILSIGLVFVFPLWKTNETVVFAMDTITNVSMLIKPIGILFIISAILSLYTIFQFKNRKLQFVLNRLNILLNLLLVGFIVYQTQNLSGETLVSEKGIGSFLPIATVFLLAIANRFIKKDEDLVKSVDRLR